MDETAVLITYGPLTVFNKRKPKLRQVGPVFQVTPCVPDTKDKDTMADAMKLRIMTSHPHDDQPYFDELEGFARIWCPFNLQYSGDPSETPVQWIANHPTYSAGRKLQVLRSLKKWGLAYRRRNRWSQFGKNECYGKYKPGRSIYQQYDEMKAKAGPIWKKFGKMLYSRDSYLLSRTPTHKWAQAIRAAGTYGHTYFIDAEAWESSISTQLMKSTEFIAYKSVGIPDEFWKFQGELNTLKPIIGGITARIEGKRTSGASNTGCGNSVINEILFNFSLMKTNNEGICFICGDDLLMMTKNEFDPQYYRRAGFTLEFEEVDDPLDAGFCSRTFHHDYKTGRDTTFADPLRIIKLPWSFKVPPNMGISKRLELLKAKAASLYYEGFGEAPVFWAWIAKYAGCGRLPLDVWRVNLLLRNGVPYRIVNGWILTGYAPSEEIGPVGPPTLQSRIHYWRNYGLSIRAQLELEEQILGCSCLIVSPAFRSFMSVNYPDTVTNWLYYTRVDYNLTRKLLRNLGMKCLDFG